MKAWSIKLIKCRNYKYIHVHEAWASNSIASTTDGWIARFAPRVRIADRLHVNCQLACVYGILYVTWIYYQSPWTIKKWQHFRCINGTEDSCIIKRIFQPCIIIHSWQITICDLLHSNNIWMLSLIGVNHFRPPPPIKKCAREKKENKVFNYNMKHKNMRMNKSKRSSVSTVLVTQSKYTCAFK